MATEAQRLKDHYLTRYEDDEETFSTYIPECFEIYRAQQAMPETQRTYRSDGAADILEKRSLPVSNNAAYVVNGIRADISSPSGMALCQVKLKKGTVQEANWVCAEEASDDIDILGEF